MVRPNQEAIDTFISITGATESVAVQKLEEYGGDLNAAVNAHFSEGDSNASMNAVRQTSVVAPQDDLMDIDDDPIESGPRAPSIPFPSAARNLNPFSLLDPNIRRSFLEGGPEFTNRDPFVTHPREVREIPIEVKDGSEPSGHGPTIEDVTESANAHGSGNHGPVIIDELNEDLPAATYAQAAARDNGSRDRYVPNPSAPAVDSLPDYSNDIEEEMIRAAIEASKQEADASFSKQHSGGDSDLGGSEVECRPRPSADVDLAQAVSLSLKTADQEKALREQGGKTRASEAGASNTSEVGLGKGLASNGRLGEGSSVVQDEAEDGEEQPLVRHRPKRTASGSVEPSREAGSIEPTPPSSPEQHDSGNRAQHDGNVFASEEWGGISSVEHDEAVMLEAAMFGGIPESGYQFPYAPHQFMRTEGSYSRQIPRPPSPSLEAQRLIREQQDNEYLEALQADREKELKMREEAEARRLEEEEARKAALEEERRKEEETRRKMEEEKECERQLAAKEASLPQEPAADDENAVTLLVRMPDGSRRGRRFLKSNLLQSLFDFIDVSRAIKPGSYRLVRAYPRRAFTDEESAWTLNELGLTSKQEALYLESA